MKTTVEIPDNLFRDAKTAAAQNGTSLRQFLTEAVADKVQTSRRLARERPWMRLAGMLEGFAREVERAEQVIEEEFERVNVEDWK